MRAIVILLSAGLLATPLTITAKVRPGVSKKSPALTGTYVLRGRKGSGAMLQVRQSSPNQIDFDLQCHRGAPSYETGGAGATIDVLNGIAVYRVGEFNGPCEIRFDFKGTTVVISQTGADFACGFGHGVSCAGTYKLTSRNPPKFRNKDQ